MNKVEISKRIVNDLAMAKYRGQYSYSDESYTREVLVSEAKDTAEAVIFDVLTEMVESRTSGLEAKVTLYEEVIKKSNFRPLLPEDAHQPDGCIDSVWSEWISAKNEAWENDRCRADEFITDDGKEEAYMQGADEMYEAIVEYFERSLRDIESRRMGNK